MLLALDVGNTHIKMALFDGETLLAVARYSSATERTVDEYRLFIKQFITEYAADRSIDGAIVSSVKPGLTSSIQEAVTTIFPPSRSEYIKILGPSTYARLPVQPDNPYQIGSDLVCNALAAYKRFCGSCVVIDFGTALSYTMINDKGRIVGVAIAPGIETAYRSLVEGTDRLPFVSPQTPLSVMGKDTQGAINAGIVFGYLDMITGMIKRIKSELGASTKIIITGGMGRLYAKIENPPFDAYDPALTLTGLRLAYESIAR